MSKKLLNRKATVEKQNTLIQSLEGIGDILVYETKRQKNKLVLQGLQKMRDSVDKLFEIQQSDPDRFEQLVVSQDFLALYKTNEKEASFRLELHPDKYLVSFSTAVNQITRIHEAAINSQNEEISRYAVYHINWILAALAAHPGNGLFVKQILSKLAVITTTATERNDRSMYAAAIHWYTDIVFNRLGRKKGDFDLSYLELFDKYFFSTARHIVSEGQTGLFHALVSSLVDGVRFPTYNQGKIWDYGHLILRSDFEKYKQLDQDHAIEKKVRELANSERDLDTKEKLDSWLERFAELKEIVERHVAASQVEEVRTLEREIREFVIAQFKYSNLIEIVFAIGAYSLFKQRPAYTNYLWEYKQPRDSDASWIGHDITPNTLNGVITFYFRKGLFERKFDFWEGHHGTEQYYKQYFLLLLGRVLQNIRADAEGRYSQLENYKLPDLHVYRLSDLGHSIEELIRLAAELQKDKHLFAELGFDAERKDELFEDKLVPFLQRLKEEANKQISAKHKTQTISPKKVEEFKEEVLKTFYEEAALRDVFVSYLKAYEDKTKEKTGKTERFGIKIVDDKAAFFDDWHVHYLGWGGNYGRGLGSDENSFLFDEIARSCQAISREEFDSTLEKFQNPKDIVIVVASVQSMQFFEQSKYFKPKWHRDTKQLGVRGFAGWYEFGNQSIPVFETYHGGRDNQILILNRSSMGQLIQLSPLNEEENESLLKNIFYMNIRAFSENPELMEQYIKKPPEWLRKIGDEQEQREHLQERVLIHIFERFEFRKAKEFDGYKLTIGD